MNPISHNTALDAQAALMAAILSFRPELPAGWVAPTGTTAPMHAHQGHVRVLAAQVLARAYPSLPRLLGSEPWPLLAQQFWQAHPPTEGHLHVWGQNLPAWLGKQPTLAAWPFLADVARLDWALHTSRLAEPQSVQAHTLAWLADEGSSPDHLVLQLQPALRLVRSPSWPMVGIWQTLAQCPHTASDEELAHRLQAVLAPRAQANTGQQAVVLGFPGAGNPVMSISPEWWAFMQALAQDNPPALGPLLPQHPGLDFSAWLTTALTQGWVWRIKNLWA